MTKEEIIKKNTHRTFIEGFIDPIISVNHEKAMDEYAKQVAIDFCDWLDMHRYEFETIASEELFNQFIEHQKK